ncbi:phosphoglucose isomerase-like protein [Herbihabitans rhizosphaerae]|uniref:Phosphoglucose isomerase-like protein n=1 Tax=Herbihabitans rhizosphaerae TaxID=1872711 RepID=A0A4V2ERS9_9PSEU|nr:SIS domain-containing protein [Herbihabitans rhizosphaerae]RZS33927.1 phosphoglucose isomerase-like protein [Herbihabitans rhizosphaerae]
MTAVLDDTLLDDPARLTEADSDGWLVAVARAGAQVRATIEAANAIRLDDELAGTPRALVLVSRPGLGPAVTELIAALLGRSCPVPVVITDIVPPWIGPLDVVLAHTEDGGDAVLAESIDRASRYGARVVVTSPPDGPVAAAAAGRALALPSPVDVPAGFGLPRALAAGLLATRALGLLRADVDALADELDREAERDHMQHESFVNPAKSLALRLAERIPLLWGLDDTATAVAAHAAQALGSYAGIACDVASYQQAQTRSALHRAAVGSNTAADIFADPDLDESPTGTPPRVLLLGLRDDEETSALRRSAAAALPTADAPALAEEISADEPGRAAVLALRFEFAALYLGLATGTIGGTGHYAA